ncbi:MAG: hypothetical protein PHY59_02040 [Methanobacterium sp.]|nr:hypothetical protein [Methanobacterium sp.]
MKINLNNMNIIGIIMILFSIFLFTTRILNHLILNITYPFLEGSSEGKSILFFGIMGSILLLYPLFNLNRYKMQKFINLHPIFKGNTNKYLKLLILIVILTYIVGIIIELIIRSKLGVSIFTTFIAMDPSPTSTSITHSHVFKSVLGDLISILGIHVAGNIHTGSSLIYYTMPISFIILITFPLTYILGLISLNQRKNRYTIILAFAITTTLIGMLDGGLFSTPALIGLSGLLGVLAVKKPFSYKVFLNPSFVIILLIILRLTIGIIGTNIEYHEITFFDEKYPINLEGYSVIDVNYEQNKTIVKISTDRSDKTILAGMVNRSKGNVSGIALSWNIYTWVTKN